MKSTPADAGGAAPSQPRLGLPKGGGAISGIGEKFAANPVTGSGSMTVPIAVSPGRAGFGPALSLAYDSAAGNGPFGFGWGLRLPAITRKTDEGVPQYGGGADPDVFILGGAEDLVPELAGDPGDLESRRETRVAFGATYEVSRYRPRIEGLFARIERWLSASDPADTFWRSISRDNVTTWYGRTPESRVFDPADPRRTFSWLVCETHDGKGNVVSYGYKREDSQGIDAMQLHERNRTDASRRANRYIKRIRYGNRAPYFPDLADSPRTPLPTDWCFEVVFDYGEHDAADPHPLHEPQPWTRRNDPFSSYRAGFEVRTYRLCQRVLMFHHFAGEPEVGENCLVRATELEYSFEADPADARNPVYSFLVAATHAGVRRRAEGGLRRSAMPAVELEYSRAVIDGRVRDVDPESLRNLPHGVDGIGYHWIDLDGDGVPGILVEQGERWHYKRNESPALAPDDATGTTTRFGPLQVLPARPSHAAPSGATQLLDLAGDGSLDLVELEGPTPGFCERTVEGGWSEHTPFRSLPAIQWSDPNVRFIDLTGDGHADVLVTENDAWCWHASLAEAGFGPAQRAQKALDDETGPRVVFADTTQSIFLADVSGDGLTDIVRVRNGEVCYWPNLGHGRFGAKVGMDQAPWFDPPDSFDPRRIRLADIDGSGTTDIIYLSGAGVRIYFNQSGNGWSPARGLAQFPASDSVASAAVVDLMGNGTACLVWSSPLAGDSRRPMRYIDLMGAQKPHLLVTARNNLGAETHVRYAPSTRFYVQDRESGTPWATRLPFPVHVVERVETIDRVSGNRFVTRYRYRHGSFDGAEREFRGFGRVDQWDTEAMGALRPGDTDATNFDAGSYVPPVHTRTWFHTGVWLDDAEISRQFASEYYREPGLDDAQARAQLLADTVVPAGLTLQEAREACRALKGSMLRQEVYAEDGSAQAENPYAVLEQNFGVVRVQPHGGNRHAVFFVHPRESVSFQYERDPANPRVEHRLTLEVDAFGNVLRSASIAYGRRQAGAGLLPQDQDRQTLPLATVDDNDFTNAVDLPDAYRTPAPSQTRRHELTGLVLSGGQRRLTFDEVDQAIAEAPEIPHEATADGSPQRRLVEQTRTLYRRDDLSGTTLPLGQIESLGLPFEIRQLAFTPGLLAHVFGDRVTDEMLAEGGYVHGESDGDWWRPSARSFLSPDAGDTPPQELAFARQHFLQVQRVRDPFGNVATISYDAHDLLPIATRDPLDNTVQVVNDYRVLQPRVVTDANGNRTEAAFDALGMVVGTAVTGKANEAVGDSLDAFAPDLDDATVAADLDAPLADPHGILQGATTRLVYDIFAYQRTRAHAQPQPTAVHTLTRETHRSDLRAGELTRVQHAFAYSDGFGREIQKKVQAEPAPADSGEQPPDPRWVGSGWTVFNNKGKPVRQFEPFFSATHRFEFDQQQGVGSVLFYDPLERVVATLHPNHTWEKVVFDPWRQESWDVSDTALIVDPADDADVGTLFRRLPAADYLPTWHAQRIGGALGPRERAAAQKTARHANTPAIAHFDPLGRPFLTVAHNRFERNGATVDEALPTRVELDIEGGQRAVRDAMVQADDALGRIVMRQDYDMLGGPVHSASMEAGERWTLGDMAGNPIRAWDSRGHAFRTEYDALRRPLRQFVRGHDPQNPTAELLFNRTEYGEGEPSAAERNLRTQAVRVFDGAGIVTSVAYDYKGNLLRSRRQFAADYRSHPDWAGEPALEADIYESSTTYDAINRPVSVDTPDGSITRPGYDHGGLLNRITVNLRGAAAAAVLLAAIEYDAKGQRTRIDYGNGARTTYEYDDSTFRLARLHTRRGVDIVQDLSYVYDPVGNISDLHDAAQQTIWFDNAVVEPHADYAYDAVYRLVSATGREHIGQLAAPQTSWNDAGRIRLPHPHDGQAMRRYAEQYEYDATGNLLRLVHQAVDGSWTRAYAYDEASALEPHKRSNRLSRTTVGTTEESCTYDLHGNVSGMPHLSSLRWDFADQLRSSARQVVMDGTPQTTWYAYDASGQRVRKVTERQAGPGAAPTRMNERIDLGGFEVYRAYGNEGMTVALERQTLDAMDDGQRVAIVETRTQGEDGSPARLVRYQLGNHLGSACLELEVDAAIVSYEEYHPYGSTAYQAGPSLAEVSSKRYRFTGKERDEETGFGYHGARYYAPWIGRWLSADPELLTDGVNLYRYALGNPVRLIDPTGTMSEPALTQLLDRQRQLLEMQQLAPEDQAIRRRLDVVNFSIERYLWRLQAEEHVARNARNLGAVEGPSMSAGSPRDMIDRAPDPAALAAAEYAQIQGLTFGPMANRAFKNATRLLEWAGLIEPMSETERRWRAVSAGELASGIASVGAPVAAGKRARERKPDRPRDERGRFISTGTSKQATPKVSADGRKKPSESGFKGILGQVRAALSELRSGQEIRGAQIRVRIFYPGENGKVLRADVTVDLVSGSAKVRLVEAKNGPHARRERGQIFGYEALEKGTFIEIEFRGANAVEAGFQHGLRLGPGQVEFKQYHWQ
jgi:RHS repeat-associated protein